MKHWMNERNKISLNSSIPVADLLKQKLNGNFPQDWSTPVKEDKSNKQETSKFRMRRLSSAKEIDLQEQIYSNEILFGDDKLCKIENHKMKDRLHRYQVAIVWRLDISRGSKVGRGSGLLISRDLVLTCAHNFYYQNQKIEWQYINLYPRQYGQLKNPFKVKEIYIPQAYQQNPINNVTNDYALVRLTERYPIDIQDQFLPLSFNFRDKVNTSKLAIFGQPGINYQNIGNEGIKQTVFQSGFTDKGRVAEIIQEKKSMLYTLSTLEGQSGSPIILIHQEGQVMSLQVIGIHKGSVKKQMNGTITQYNVGRVLNFELIEELRKQVKRMGAEMFYVAEQVPPAARRELQLLQLITSLKVKLKQEIKNKDRIVYEFQVIFSKTQDKLQKYQIKFNDLAKEMAKKDELLNYYKQEYQKKDKRQKNKLQNQQMAAQAKLCAICKGSTVRTNSTFNLSQIAGNKENQEMSSIKYLIQQEENQKLEKEVQSLAQQVITGKSNKINLSGRKLRNLDGLKGIKIINQLYLGNNQLLNVDGLKGFTFINTLYLSYNQLQNLEGLKGIKTIKNLFLHNNPDLVISKLHSSLEQLSANVCQILKFDFKYLFKLRKLWSDSEERQVFRNLGYQVQVAKIWQQK